jgi:hypothetical protein
MMCPLCRTEAVLVDSLGREMGPPYYYCRTCKLEQREWEERRSKEIFLDFAATELTPKQLTFNGFTDGLITGRQTKDGQAVAHQVAVDMFDCIQCGAGAGEECRPDCQLQLDLDLVFQDGGPKP